MSSTPCMVLLTSLRELTLIKRYTDNRGVASIVMSGSNKIHLHKLAMDIFSLSRECQIVIAIEWIPRSENELADY